MEEVKRDYLLMEYIYGDDMMSKIRELKVLVIGMRGLGFEIAKNLILSGVNTLSIHDPTISQIQDMGANFYISDTDVGKITRAEATASKFKSTSTKIIAINESINKEIINQHHIVFLTELLLPWQDILLMNQYCRQQSKAFIMSLVLGLYGCIFVDFGDKFKIGNTIDNTSCYIDSITNSNPGVVEIHCTQEHSFYDGDLVTFKEIEGMTELNTMNPIKIKVNRINSFSICDTSSFGKYVSGGIMESVVMPLEMKFKSLVESLDEGLEAQIYPDPVLNHKAKVLHIGLGAIVKYYELHKVLPELNNVDNAKEVYKIANELNEKLEHKFSNDDMEIVMNIPMYSRAEITSMCSFFGGIASQEGLKIIGKYIPLQQWFHYDSFDSLPTINVNRTPIHSRYDNFVSIYGQETLKELQDLKLLLAGAGGLGCEFAKAFSLLGLATSKGQLMITDDDIIKDYNLSKGFMFTESDIDKYKVNVIMDVIKKANPLMNIKALMVFAESSNEETLYDKVWDDISVIISAVNNFEGRAYLDSKSVWHRKVFIDSATEETKGSVQIVIPKLTQSYTDIGNFVGIESDLCSIMNFPTSVKEMVDWALRTFDSYFVEIPLHTHEYLTNPKESNEIYVHKILELIRLKKGNPFENCIIFALKQFKKLFNEDIIGIIEAIKDTNNDGKAFWNNFRRRPTPTDFDVNNGFHFTFVYSLASLMLGVLGLSPDKLTKDQVLKVANGFTFKMDVEEIQGAEKVNLLKEEVKGLKEDDFIQIEFDKDDDLHIDFIYAAINTKAKLYKIKEIDKVQVKVKAGNIVPTIITVTAMTVGYACTELIKVVQKIKQFKDASFNLALPLFLFSPSAEPIKITSKEFDHIIGGPVKAIPENHTKWDTIDLHSSMTIRELIKKIENDYEVKVSAIVCGQVTIYMEIMGDKNIDVLIEERVEQVTKSKLTTNIKSLRLDIVGDINDDTSAIFPAIIYIL